MSSQKFDEFMKRRDEVARAYVSGDAAPLGDIVTRDSPATFFGPRGGDRQGAKNVWSTYERDAAAFAPDGDSTLEILDMGASDDLAFWVGYQRVTARLGGSPEPKPMSLRVTGVFRREDDEWKLVHRHADSLASPRDDAS